MDGFGGVYQYTLNLLQAIGKYRKQGFDEFVLFTDNTNHHIIKSLESSGWEIEPLTPISGIKKLVKKVLKKIVDLNKIDKFLYHSRKNTSLRFIPYDPDVIRYKPERQKWFKSFGIKLMIYPTVHPLSFESKIPFITAIHDLQYLLQPEFLEVSAKGEWERREYAYRNCARHAITILVDSKIGMEDVIRSYGKYGVGKEKIKILPFLPANYLTTHNLLKEKQRISKLFQLPDDYLFYPAQFWPHKNHLRIVKALGLLKQEKRLDIPIVFCGLQTGEIRKKTFNEVMSEAAKLAVDKNIFYLGYIEDACMSGLYSGAKALVMPTFFGPTNIPVLEAWQFNCPVLTSDIRGIREQVGEAAVLVDPKSVDGIAQGIYQLWTDQRLRQKLIKKGKQRLNSYQFNDFYDRFERILDKTKKLVK